MYKVDLGSFHKPDFYNLLLEKWKEEYFKIKKINKLMSKLTLTGSVKNDMDLMFAMMMKDNNDHADRGDPGKTSESVYTD